MDQHSVAVGKLYFHAAEVEPDLTFFLPDDFVFFFLKEPSAVCQHNKMNDEAAAH